MIFALAANIIKRSKIRLVDIERARAKEQKCTKMWEKPRWARRFNSSIKKLNKKFSYNYLLGLWLYFKSAFRVEIVAKILNSDSTAAAENVDRIEMKKKVGSRNR